MFRLRDRLVGVCIREKIKDCAVPSYWSNRMPDLFCLQGSCPKGETPADRFQKALNELPDKVSEPIEKEIRKKIMEKDCSEAEHPRRCRLRKKAIKEGIPLDEVDKLIDDLTDDLSDGPLGGAL